MLQGEKINLRPVRQGDLERLYDFHQDISNRGSYFPIGVMSEPVFIKKFSETGFWQESSGMLLMVDERDEILGHIEFFETVSYLEELELSYQLYDQDHAGRGITTEAVSLLTDYLFNQKKINRIRLMIHPENSASIRVAEKCGYVHEGTSRGAWFHQGRNHDVEVYAITRQDVQGAES